VDSLNYIGDHLDTAMTLYRVSGGTISSVIRLMRRDSVQKARKNSTLLGDRGSIDMHAGSEGFSFSADTIMTRWIRFSVGFAIIAGGVGLLAMGATPLILGLAHYGLL